MALDGLVKAPEGDKGGLDLTSNPDRIVTREEFERRFTDEVVNKTVFLGYAGAVLEYHLKKYKNSAYKVRDVNKIIKECQESIYEEDIF